MTRSRTVRRQLEREQRKLDDARWKLAMLQVGFHPSRPIEVESASQIEPQVRGMRCPVCDVGFQVVEHTASPSGRDVAARCPQCGRKPHLYFVIRSALAN
jgi:hypothetical protein